MIASLGMYDMPAVQGANDRLWQAVRDILGFGPDHLSRNVDLWKIWTRPDLLLAQTCGYPYRARLHDKVSYVGTPDYALPGCPAGYYCSVIVVSAQGNMQNLADLNACRFAFNEGLSQSGWAAPMTLFAANLIQPGHFLQTGSHHGSALAVLNSHADAASIDAQTWRLLQAHDPAMQDLRVLVTTEPTPGLPLITAQGNDAHSIRNAVAAAIAAMTEDDRAALGLAGLVHIEKSAYLAVPSPPPPPSDTMQLSEQA